MRQHKLRALGCCTTTEFTRHWIVRDSNATLCSPNFTCRDSTRRSGSKMCGRSAAAQRQGVIILSRGKTHSLHTGLVQGCVRSTTLASAPAPIVVNGAPRCSRDHHLSHQLCLGCKGKTVGRNLVVVESDNNTRCLSNHVRV